MRSRGSRWALVLILLGSVLLGAVLAVVKGRDDGLGYFIGNLSAPYLLGAFLAGRVLEARVPAVLAGVLVTWSTLGAFYLSAELVFGYPSGSMTRYSAEWFIAGALSGTAMGLLGRWSRDRTRVTLVLPAALVLEPFAVVAVQSAGRFGGLHLDALQLTAWSAEVVVGASAFVVMRSMRRRRPGAGRIGS